MFCHNLEISLNLAFNFAKENRHEFMTIEHMLLSLCDNPNVLLVLNQNNIDILLLKHDLIQYIKNETPQCHLHRHLEIQPSLEFQKVLQRAILQVQAIGEHEVNGVHVLYAILNEKDSQATFLLNKHKLYKDNVMDYLGIRKDINYSHNKYKNFNENEHEISDSETFVENESIIDKYTKNLMVATKNAKIDPVIGREDEISRMIQILCRRRKNNPLLIGEPGVGKTALAEGLALKILNNKVPDELKNCVIYSLDLGLLLAGTKYRGDFEKRFKDLLKELKAIDNVIIFIDEIHTIVGAGAASGGAIDAANLLKPLISTGNLKCMGATTYTEYRNIFEKDKALARRFQKVDIAEPSIKDAEKMLAGLKKYFEDFHNIKYTDDAISSAVSLSVRYIHNKFLPDKAIDLIDEAAAFQKTLTKNKRVNVITHKEIEQVVSTIARVPVDVVSNEDKVILQNLEHELQKTIFGQDKAIKALVTAIKLSRSGLGNIDKPVGSFLFNGPTGVGKTELCLQLAKKLGVKLLRFDMSEFMEKHTISQLIGAPAGYVGFEQGGQLTESVANNPYSLLLLDEIEKAHPDLLNILLQVMDHGELMDNTGRHINFRNVILVMTSNTGAKSYEKYVLGFNQADNTPDAAEAVKKFFSPEFRNRLDAIVPFKPLSQDVIKKVVDKFIIELKEQLVVKGVKLNISASAKKWLAVNGYEASLGARPMKRLIDNSIRFELADELIFGALSKGGEVKVNYNKGKLLITSK
jgi:ATP-dependent Clp protease ATP-binding subunit ClpA